MPREAPVTRATSGERSMETDKTACILLALRILPGAEISVREACATQQVLKAGILANGIVDRIHFQRHVVGPLPERVLQSGERLSLLVQTDVGGRKHRHRVRWSLPGELLQFLECSSGLGLAPHAAVHIDLSCPVPGSV